MYVKMCVYMCEYNQYILYIYIERESTNNYKSEFYLVTFDYKNNREKNENMY